MAADYLRKNMNRKETTAFLEKILICSRFSGPGKYWAREVSIDHGTIYIKRIDFIQFVPAGTIHISDIEKGIFVCYEIKSCREDVYSGNGLNFLGEKNYLITTMQCYKDILPDINSGKLQRHIRECNPESSADNFGIMVPVPYGSDVHEEFEHPTELNTKINWNLKTVLPCHQGRRKRSMSELLFCMLRSAQK